MATEIIISKKIAVHDESLVHRTATALGRNLRRDDDWVPVDLNEAIEELEELRQGAPVENGYEILSLSISYPSEDETDEDISVNDVIDWADGIYAASGTELADRVTEQETAISQAIRRMDQSTSNKLSSEAGKDHYSVKCNLGTKPAPFFIERDIGTCENVAEAQASAIRALMDCKAFMTWFVYKNGKNTNVKVETTPEPIRGYEYRLTLNGETMSDIESALTEATKQINQNNVFGFDSNKTGSFSFERVGQEFTPIVSVKVKPVVPFKNLHEDDQDISGTFEIKLDAGTDEETWADVALDVFHSNIPVKVLDDFEISAWYGAERLATNDGYDSYGNSDGGTVWQFIPEPVPS